MRKPASVVALRLVVLALLALSSSAVRVSAQPGPGGGLALDQSHLGRAAGDLTFTHFDAGGNTTRLYRQDSPLEAAWMAALAALPGASWEPSPDYKLIVETRYATEPTTFPQVTGITSLEWSGATLIAKTSTSNTAFVMYSAQDANVLGAALALARNLATGSGAPSPVLSKDTVNHKVVLTVKLEDPEYAGCRGYFDDQECHCTTDP